MNPGELRHRIDLQHSTDAKQPAGGMKQTWTTYATVWAQVKSLTVNQIISSRQDFSVVSAKVRIRYMDGVHPTDRILFGTRMLGILGVLPDTHRSELTLMCSELSNGTGTVVTAARDNGNQTVNVTFSAPTGAGSWTAAWFELFNGGTWKPAAAVAAVAGSDRILKFTGPGGGGAWAGSLVGNLWRINTAPQSIVVPQNGTAT